MCYLIQFSNIHIINFFSIPILFVMNPDFFDIFPHRPICSATIIQFFYFQFLNIFHNLATPVVFQSTTYSCPVHTSVGNSFGNCSALHLFYISSSTYTKTFNYRTTLFFSIYTFISMLFRVLHNSRSRCLSLALLQILFLICFPQIF